MRSGSECDGAAGPCSGLHERSAPYGCGMNRRLLWDGCRNVRDLGGLPTRDGGNTARAALVRSDHPNRLSAAGWAELRACGTRTIVTLMTDGVPVADQMLAVAPNERRSLRSSMTQMSRCI
jgi:hypothetical protein